MVKKAVILAAGSGTRLRPLTLGIPKELILVGKQPVIFYALEQIKNAEITSVQVVTGWKKGTIQDTLGSGKKYGFRISYAFQNEPLGVGDAYYHAKEFVGDDDSALLFGDNIIIPDDALKKLAEYHKQNQSMCTLLVKEIDDPERFGVVKTDDNGRIVDMFEKPKSKEEKDLFRQKNGKYLAIIGMYIFKNKIFEAIENTKPGAKGEIQITDAIKILVKQDYPCYALSGNVDFTDMGTFSSLFEINKKLYEKMDIRETAKRWEELMDT